MARSHKGAQAQQQRIFFIDESGFYPLPSVVRTYAPVGQTPIMREWWTRDHLSAISAIPPEGKLYFHSQDHAIDSADVVAFLEHLLREVSGRMVIIWDGAPIHRSHLIQEFLAHGAAPRLHLERLPAYAPELNPGEGLWQQLKGVELRNVCCFTLSHLRVVLLGLGPYKFVSFKPGVELVLEAFEDYWRTVPHVKRLIMKGVPEGATRLAMLKKGEADFAVALQGPLAEEVKRDPRLTLVDTRHPSMFWIEFADQWDPKSPWHDQRVRLAVNYALDRQAINEAACLGYCPPAGVIVPRLLDYALPVEPLPYDPQKAVQLLAEAGYPNGFDAGELVPIPPFHEVGEAVVNYLNAISIRVKMRTMERAAFYTAWREKKLHGLFIPGAGISGNAATRVEAFMYSQGSYAYGGYPDIDELFHQQTRERDPAKREALLHRIQQLTVERVMFAPIYDLRGLTGVGYRVAEHTINSIPLHPGPAFENIQLKAQ